jgi:peptide/nickel transport system permease protein
MIIGLVLGILAGYFGGALDMVVMRLTDIQLSIPFLVLTLSIMAVFGPGLLNVILVLGVVSWVSYARIVRGQVLVLRELEFVQAARAVGASNLRILIRHILPNVIGQCVVIGTLEVARAILSEAALSFLGMGVTPPTPAWGSMISEARNYLYVAWWAATFPGLAIFITVLGVNTLGDSLRDYMDPRLRI